MIKEVLCLVPDKCKEPLEAILKNTSEYDRTHFISDLSVRLAGQVFSYDDIDACVSAVEEKLVSETT